MIRPATALWIALAGVIGFGLYHLKHQVQALEDELFRVNRTILAEQEAIHVLHAEWSYLNQPSRLQALASRHLELQPMKPSQLGTLDSLPRLPGDAPAPLLSSAPAAPAPKGPTVKVVAIRPVAVASLPQKAARPVSHESAPAPRAR